MTSMYEEGRPDAPICFIGEAPSFTEKRMNRPFVGEAGEVFNDCLHQAGIIRHNSYILNVWEFETKKDFVQNIYRRNRDGSRGDKLWTPARGFTEEGLEAAAGCLSRLQNATPNVFVPMGQVAMDLVLHDRRKVGKWRGSIVAGGPAVNGRKVVITVHPASTLYGGDYVDRYIIMADMEKAREEARSPELILPQRNIIIDPSFSDTIEYLHKTLAEPRVATDIEVINHQVSCFCLCSDPAEVMVVPIGDETGSAWWNEAQEMEIWRLYAEIMGSAEIEKINQNLIGFDVPFLLQQNNIFTHGFLGDTMIAQAIMYPDFRKGLDFICSIRTREPYYKEEGKMWKGMGGDIKEFWRYNGKDGAVALESWDILAEEMTQDGYWETYFMTAGLSDVLQYMTVRGFAVNHERLHTMHDKISLALKEKEAELDAVAEYPFNPGSPKQCQQYFYVTKGIKPYMGKTGNVTTDDKAMARIFRRYNLKEAKLVQDIRGLRKLKGTYLEIEFDKDSRLRCSWDPRGTWTGRLSSSKTVFGTGANMQNLDPRFKGFLVADEEEFQSVRTT